MLEDLGSSNGTYLNGQRLISASALKSGDIFLLGSAVRLKFEDPTEPALTELEGTAKTMLDVPVMPAHAETILAEEMPSSPASQLPVLNVTIAGGQGQSFSLDKPRYTLGRSSDNDIVIASPIVSSHHAVLEKSADGFSLTSLPDATNPIYSQGEVLSAPQPLHDGDILRIGSIDPGVMVSLEYRSPAEASSRGMARQITFGEKNHIQIGRDPSNDVVLDAPTISRYHALVERVGQRYRVRDLGSTNGTFVNDLRIAAETWLQSGDAIRIGAYRFVLGADRLTEFDESSGLRLEAIGLNKWVRKDLNLLKNISLLFKPREFVVIVGQSGGGKSTLVDAIAGYRPATDGRVLVNDTDVYKNFDVIRNQIGFVPQKDIIHMELTVYQELEYAAQLRMPADTTPEECHQRVMEVLADLDLVHRKDVQISGLSGGQQKRVSIGVELLTKPGLFFLDEPTSGLDPGTETALMHLMRRLADQGRTIILITHATKNVMLADKVVFLARGGYLAWFGPPDEALQFFDQYRSERDRHARSMEFDEIYAILDDPGKGKAEDWAKRYREHPAYQKHIIAALAQYGHSPEGAAAPPAEGASPPESTGKARTPRTSGARASSARQFRILSARNIKILTRDRTSLILMLAVAPIVGLLDVVLSVTLGRDLFDYKVGSMANVITSMFMPLMYAILVGALSQMREFVKETDIYKRERLVNLRAFPYVLSKVWVAILLALYQTTCYTVIHYLAFKMPGGAAEFVLFYGAMFLVVLSGMMLGLLGSAIAPNANAAPLIVILLIVPQLVLAGALIPLPGAVTALTTTRWAFELLVSVSGVGSKVSADLCWELPEEVLDDMPLAVKDGLNCGCMGSNVLRQASCEFPGIGEFYDPAIDQPEPVQPSEIGSPPAEPEIPPPPEQPVNQSDQVAMAEFLQAMKSYQEKVDGIREDYKRQIEQFQAKADVFKAEMIDYQKNLATWEIDRNAAVGKAEGIISSFYHDFSWAFVDKQNSQAYWSKLLRAGLVQIVYQMVCFVLIYLVMRRKA